jgi:hypothetical protein
MALTKKFIEQVASFSRAASDNAAKAHTLGIDAVKSAYANQELDKAQFLMDNVPQYMRKPFCAWFKRAGLDVAPPDAGSARFVVLQVIDRKRQSKAFAWVDANPVLTVTHEVVQEKKAKELKGTPDERAQKAMASLITRLKESDPDTAAIINDVWASEYMAPTNSIFDDKGNEIALSPYECQMALREIVAKRLTEKLAA